MSRRSKNAFLVIAEAASVACRHERSNVAWHGELLEWAHSRTGAAFAPDFIFFNPLPR
jgi:hypothetical protein